jgi:hypothetical protein
MDPADVETRTETKKQAPWTGYWFVNVGEGPHRNWSDNVKYGYIGAGQGPKYSEPLKKLKEGDSIFAYMSGHGYVGYGVVLESTRMLKDFLLDDKGTNLLTRIETIQGSQNGQFESIGSKHLIVTMR